MIPLLLKPPKGKQARVVGLGPAVFQALQDLRTAGWPTTLHDPQGGGSLAGLPGIHISNDPPEAGALRQASLVLIGRDAPEAWRSESLARLEGTGIPFLDEGNPSGSTLLVPQWIRGESFSVALWGEAGPDSWKATLAEEFLHSTEGLFHSFLKLAGELERLTLDSMEEGEFRRKVVAQIARPEILARLLQGEYDKAKTLALRIIGTTTRSL